MGILSNQGIAADGDAAIRMGGRITAYRAGTDSAQSSGTQCHTLRTESIGRRADRRRIITCFGIRTDGQRIVFQSFCTVTDGNRTQFQCLGEFADGNRGISVCNILLTDSNGVRGICIRVTTVRRNGNFVFGTDGDGRFFIVRACAANGIPTSHYDGVGTVYRIAVTLDVNIGNGIDTIVIADYRALRGRNRCALRAVTVAQNMSVCTADETAPSDNGRRFAACFVSAANRNRLVAFCFDILSYCNGVNSLRQRIDTRRQRVFAGCAVVVVVAFRAVRIFNAVKVVFRGIDGLIEAVNRIPDIADRRIQTINGGVGLISRRICSIGGRFQCRQSIVHGILVRTAKIVYGQVARAIHGSLAAQGIFSGGGKVEQVGIGGVELAAVYGISAVRTEHAGGYVLNLAFGTDCFTDGNNAVGILTGGGITVAQGILTRMWRLGNASRA